MIEQLLQYNYRDICCHYLISDHINCYKIFGEEYISKRDFYHLYRVIKENITVYNYWILMRSTHDYKDLVNDWLTEDNDRG